MPTRITIECTHCGAKLNLADDSKLGKKIKCPKCSEVFIASSGDDDDLEVLDDDDEEEDERPRGKKAAAPAGRKSSPAKGKKGKGKSGGNLGLIIGGSVGAVVLLGGLVGVLYATGAFGGKKPDPNQIQVGPGGNGVFGSLLKEQAAAPIPARSPIPEVAKWLPADTEFVMHVRPAEILASLLVTDLLKSLQLDQQINLATAQLGFQPADIESVTVGVVQWEKAQQQIQQAQMEMMMGRQPKLSGANTPSIAVIKLKKSITADDVIKFGGALSPDQPVQKVQHAGKEYLESTDPKTSVKGGAYLATSNIVLMGESAHVKAAIDRGANANPLRNFGFVDWNQQLTLAYAPMKAESLQKQLSAGSQANPMAGVALAPLAAGASGFSLGLSVKGGLEAEIAVGCLDAEKTTQITKSLTDLTGVGRGQYDQTKSHLPPWASALTDLLMSNLKVSGSNRVVLVQTNIPDSAKEQLVALPGMIMMQYAMSATLPKPGNSPGADSATDSSPGNSTSPGDDPEPDAPTDETKTDGP